MFHRSHCSCKFLFFFHKISTICVYERSYFKVYINIKVFARKSGRRRRWRKQRRQRGSQFFTSLFLKKTTKWKIYFITAPAFRFNFTKNVKLTDKRKGLQIKAKTNSSELNWTELTVMWTSQNKTVAIYKDIKQKVKQTSVKL